MNKIGIITIQKSEVNYGACLQSYALWKSVSNMGYDCEIIDLLRPDQNRYIFSRYFPEKLKKKTLKQKIAIKLYRFRHRNEVRYINDFLKVERFREFCDTIKYSHVYRSVDELYDECPLYDLFLTGSDQVWNPTMPFINEPYFLSFVPSGIKKVSFASSFGIDEIPVEVEEKYRQWLDQYDSVSVREESGARIIVKLGCKRPQVVLDPVFLLSSADWQMETKSIEGPKPYGYVFLYMLHYDEDLVKEACRIAGLKRLPVYMVLSEDKRIVKPSVTQLLGIGPREWLWMIENAATVVTSSFHGTAFCIIFKKDFAAFVKKGCSKNSRITDLLSRLGLSKHLYYLGETTPKIEDLTVQDNGDWNDLFASELIKTREYLRVILSKANNT